MKARSPKEWIVRVVQASLRYMLCVRTLMYFFQLDTGGYLCPSHVGKKYREQGWQRLMRSNDGPAIFLVCIFEQVPSILLFLFFVRIIMASVLQLVLQWLISRKFLQYYILIEILAALTFVVIVIINGHCRCIYKMPQWIWGRVRKSDLAIEISSKDFFTKG